jgi:hypothetical protein
MSESSIPHFLRDSSHVHISPYQPMPLEDLVMHTIPGRYLQHFRRHSLMHTPYHSDWTESPPHPPLTELNRRYGVWNLQLYYQYGEAGAWSQASLSLSSEESFTESSLSSGSPVAWNAIDWDSTNSRSDSDGVRSVSPLMLQPPYARSPTLLESPRSGGTDTGEGESWSVEVGSTSPNEGFYPFLPHNYGTFRTVSVIAIRGRSFDSACSFPRSRDESERGRRRRSCMCFCM